MILYDKDEENLVSVLNDQVNKLKISHSSLAEKNKQLSDALEKKKKEILVLKRSGSFKVIAFGSFPFSARVSILSKFTPAVG